MSRPSRTLSNGIACHVQKTETDGDRFAIGVCVSLPSRDPQRPGAGIYHLADDSAPWVRAIERAEGYDVDGAYRNVAGPQTVSPLVNGCIGVWYGGKGRITQAKINRAFARVCRITARARLDKDTP